MLTSLKLMAMMHISFIKWKSPILQWVVGSTLKPLQEKWHLITLSVIDKLTKIKSHRSLIVFFPQSYTTVATYSSADGLYSKA